MWQRLIDANRYFSKGWRIMAYQPVLYFFIFGAGIRLWLNETEPPPFYLIGDHFYGMWLILGIFGPVLALMSWFLIQKLSGRWTFVGMWIRFSGDICVFTGILTYHMVSVKQLHVDNEEQIFSRYIIGATLIFVMSLVVRDIWAIIAMERLAAQIHSEEL